jgi:hypothetical protein
MVFDLAVEHKGTVIGFQYLEAERFPTGRITRRQPGECLPSTSPRRKTKK